MEGWEIDIDNKTAERYKNWPGEIGDKLRKNINFGNPSQFKLNKKHTCAFLNDNHLCELCLTIGEENLCYICKEHPRYYEWFDGIKEAGVGLCCEEAARLILSFDEKFSTYEKEIEFDDCDDYDKELYNYLFSAREKIINYLDSDGIDIETKIRNILWYAHTLQQNIDNELLDDEEIIDIKKLEKNDEKINILGSIIDFYLKLEPNDITWFSGLEKIKNNSKKYYENLNIFNEKNTEKNNYLKNISIYFVWRYFMKATFDGDVLSRIKLMATSIKIIDFLFFNEFEQNALSLESAIDVVRRYSEEIEYCDENIQCLADASYEQEIFSTENLMKLF